MIIQIIFTLALGIEFGIADDWDSDNVSTDLDFLMGIKFLGAWLSCLMGAFW